ncbi:restriction endonuclease subunit S [Corynebacterium callunae]|uniref:Restriction modification system DNA specificity domain-containing protein n=1 Tax=Corynebacterium callunae DSM 20147 TaxID=1121353 RepID=M1TPE4_9CORY|nr:restriction endonuclease subunit S [Corynebacterium callunae]AGG66216.1 restriction modification system DNA specificity domain-containing protein [Corynebacterium callunae DSM 20147]
MALFTTRPFVEAVLSTKSDISGSTMHVFEPEFHQEIYRSPAEIASASAHGSFQLADAILQEPIHRGVQPEYSDDLDDPDSLAFIGMMTPDGTRLSKNNTDNVAAIKSVGIRSGYVDIDSSRSVSSEFFRLRTKRAGVQRNDLLINSTGDGTIGRVAVYHYDFPAVVDGHVSIIRFKNPDLAWYTAAYLLTNAGQHQIYRYINGSSGQVEIYPQDFERLVIPKASTKEISEIGNQLKLACTHFESFRTHLGATIAQATQSSEKAS